MVTRVIEDETILLPLYKSSDEINCIYTLNKVASEVWNLIDGKKTLADIKKQVLKKFDTTPKEVNKEMQKVIAEGDFLDFTDILRYRYLQCRQVCNF